MIHRLFDFTDYLDPVDPGKTDVNWVESGFGAEWSCSTPSDTNVLLANVHDKSARDIDSQQDLHRDE